MKALTLHQPWASLVALGVKSIETRSWATSYRGPLVIHAGAKPPTAADFPDTIPGRAGWIGAYNLGRWAEHVRHADPCDCDEDEETTGDRCMAASEWSHALLADEGAHGFSLATTLPLGAVVASCTLADVVPILTSQSHPHAPSNRPAGGYVYAESDRLFYYPMEHNAEPVWVEDQRPYGDFAPGRFAWLLEDVKPTTERCPAGCRPVHFAGDPEDGHHRIATDPATATTSWDSWIICSCCDGEGWCDPVPARGRQRLWEWTPELAATP